MGFTFSFDVCKMQVILIVDVEKELISSDLSLTEIWVSTLLLSVSLFFLMTAIGIIGPDQWKTGVTGEMIQAPCCEGFEGWD